MYVVYRSPERLARALIISPSHSRSPTAFAAAASSCQGLPGDVAKTARFASCSSDAAPECGLASKAGSARRPDPEGDGAMRVLPCKQRSQKRVTFGGDAAERDDSAPVKQVSFKRAKSPRSSEGGLSSGADGARSHHVAFCHSDAAPSGACLSP